MFLEADLFKSWKLKGYTVFSQNYSSIIIVTHAKCLSRTNLRVQKKSLEGIFIASLNVFTPFLCMSIIHNYLPYLPILAPSLIWHWFSYFSHLVTEPSYHHS